MDALWLALIYAAQTQVLLRLQSRAQQTLLQRRSPVSFSFLIRIHEQECLICRAFPHIPSVSVTGSYTGTCLLTLRGRPLPRILSRPPRQCPNHQLNRLQLLNLLRQRQLLLQHPERPNPQHLLSLQQLQQHPLTLLVRLPRLLQRVVC